MHRPKAILVQSQISASSANRIRSGGFWEHPVQLRGGGGRTWGRPPSEWPPDLWECSGGILENPLRNLAIWTIRDCDPALSHCTREHLLQTANLWEVLEASLGIPWGIPSAGSPPTFLRGELALGLAGRGCAPGCVGVRGLRPAPRPAGAGARWVGAGMGRAGASRRIPGHFLNRIHSGRAPERGLLGPPGLIAAEPDRPPQRRMCAQPSPDPRRARRPRPGLCSHQLTWATLLATGGQAPGLEARRSGRDSLKGSSGALRCRWGEAARLPCRRQDHVCDLS
eukprot:gene5458-biopygen9627